MKSMIGPIAYILPAVYFKHYHIYRKVSHPDSAENRIAWELSSEAVWNCDIYG